MPGRDITGPMGQGIRTGKGIGPFTGGYTYGGKVTDVQVW